MGLFNRNHNLVIMDGTNQQDVWSIIAKVGNAVPKGKSGIMKLNSLDEWHPNIYVLTYKIGIMQNLRLQKAIDRKYPGLCCYDVAV